ncbi:MAG: NADH-quinone oxidoreductase subunit L [Polyangiaceae bacterium]|nr:NADH-quinone oxidoreductase subunit L [Polyangiaceae bacterium]
MTSRDVLQLAPLVLASLVPTILIIGNIFVSERAPFRVPIFATSLTAGLSGLAVLLQAIVSLLGYPAGESRIFRLVQLDVVSSAMLILVSTLAVVVVRYSQTYLAGERGLDRYARSLLMTIASVTILVISNHLVSLIAGWIATGVFLHQLLIFYRTRRQAIIVAHKKFLLGRVADLCFLGSLAVMSTEAGSLRIDALNSYADHLTGPLSPPLQLATVLLVLGVLLKTAQLPFHGWMLQVMEAPTPVSALLHAGVVNIGGFVMIRLSPLMAHATIAQDVLLGVGLVTALLGSLVMMTRMSIKLVLAWSTIAQMGFMLVQCGLGVWHLALLHLLAHSFYKAHCFLTSGNVVETWRGTSLVHPRKSILATLIAVSLMGTVAAGLWTASTRYSLHVSPPMRTLTLALVLSFVPMFGKAVAAGARAFIRAVVLTVGATIAYYVGHAAFENLIPEMHPGPALDLRWWIVLGGLVLLFLVQTVLQASPNGLLARLLQPYVHSGLYLDDWFTRVTFRLWPPLLERAAAVRPTTSARPTRQSRIF